MITVEERIQKLKGKYNASISRLERIGKQNILLFVKPDDDAKPFKEGQSVALGLGEWEDGLKGTLAENSDPDAKLIRRAYSISSSPDPESRVIDSNSFQFYISLVNGEKSLTPRLFNLNVGSRLLCTNRPNGEYTIDLLRHQKEDSKDRFAFFCSTGTGEAPNNAMISKLLSNGYQGTIVSIICNRYKRDCAYHQDHLNLQDKLKNYIYISLFTREDEVKLYIQDVLKDIKGSDRRLANVCAGNSDFFLCGNPDMIGIPKIDKKSGVRSYPVKGGAVELLEGLGFKDNGSEPAVFYENYW